MKELQYRQKKLLQYLIELNDFKPVRYFSERLSVSYTHLTLPTKA